MNTKKLLATMVLDNSLLYQTRHRYLDHFSNPLTKIKKDLHKLLWHEKKPTTLTTNYF